MARMGLPIGPTVLKYTLPSGVTVSQTVNLVGGYNVVYIRMFRNRATVLTSNDPVALPVKSQAPVPTVNNQNIAPTTPTIVTPLPATLEPQPSEGAFAGLKKLWGGFQDPQSEQLAPLPVAPVSSTTTISTTPQASVPVSNLSPSNSLNNSPNPSPASGNMEGVKPYEPPNLLNSFQQLFN